MRGVAGRSHRHIPARCPRGARPAVAEVLWSLASGGAAERTPSAAERSRLDPESSATSAVRCPWPPARALPARSRRTSPRPLAAARRPRQGQQTPRRPSPPTGSSRGDSRRLCSLGVASSSFTTRRRRSTRRPRRSPAPALAQLARMPAAASASSSSRCARDSGVRSAVACPPPAAVSRSHHVGVDLGSGVLGVAEIQQRASLDHAEETPPATISEPRPDTRHSSAGRPKVIARARGRSDVRRVDVRQRREVAPAGVRRWISTVAPSWRPVASRCFRWPVEAGSMPYYQPLPRPVIQRGTLSCGSRADDRLTPKTIRSPCA